MMPAVTESGVTEMENKRKIAIIGASLFQDPLILKAQEMGIETHVFAWKTGDIGESLADYFYPISTREKDRILQKCREIGVEGIISIGSDLAMDTVNYVADRMGLTGNSLEATRISMNKHCMREAFEKNGDPSPKSIMVDMGTDLSTLPELEYPVIVKPTDRSGSRGVNKLESPEGLAEAIAAATDVSFEDRALIEEFVEGDEYSVEYISYQGKHYMLAVTKKFTTGAPHFIETGHIQPADISDELRERIRQVADHALDTLMLENGAAHVELKVDDKGVIKLIEIGGRMGGDFIGSDLVQLSTGYDFVGNVVRIAMGDGIDEPEVRNVRTVGIRFITGKDDLKDYSEMKKKAPGCIIKDKVDRRILLKADPTNIYDRCGYYIYEVR